MDHSGNELIQALQITHSASATVQQRQSAYGYTQNFKQRPDSLDIAFSLLSRPQGNELRHFALHVIEHWIETKWTQMGPENQLELRTKVLQVVSTAVNPDFQAEARFILLKLSQLLVHLGKRQFPQYWPNMMDNLLQIWKLGPVHAFIVMGTFRGLAEDCTSSDFNSVLPTQRRQDILKGLHSCNTILLPEIYQCLEAQYREFRQNSANATSLRVIITGLEMLLPFIDWVPIRFLLEESCHLYRVFLILMKEPNQDLKKAAFECLQVLVRRQFHKDQVKEQLEISHTLMLEIHQLNFEKLIQQRTFEKEELDSVHALNETLVLWGLNQLDTFFNLSIDPDAPDITPEVRATRLARRNVVAQYTTLLSTLMYHPSLLVLERQTNVWLNIFKNPIVVASDFGVSAIDKMWRLLFERFLKFGSPNEENSTSCFASLHDFDDEEAFVEAFGRIRGRCIAILRVLVLLQPTQGTLRLQYFVQEMFQQQILPAHSSITPGSVEESTGVYIYLEGTAALVDAFMRPLTAEMLHQPCDATQTVAAVLASILRHFLDFETRDPLLLYRQLNVLSSFTKLYNHDSNTLLPVLERLFSFITFVPPNETFIPAAKTEVLGDGNTTISPSGRQSLSENTWNARRRASSSLISICKALPHLMLQCFPDLCNRVLVLVRSNELLHCEQVLLYEMLVVVSNSMPDLETQKNFLIQMMTDPVRIWTSPQMGELVQSGSSLITPIQTSERHTTESGVIVLLHQLRTIHGVAKRITAPQGSTRTAFEVIWGHIIPNVINLIASLHSLWEPSLKAQVLAHPRACWALAITLDELVFLLKGKDQIDEALFQINAQNSEKSWSKWQKNVREVAYHLLGTALLHADCYDTIPELPTYLQRALVDGLPHMEHRHLSFLLVTIVQLFIKGCPQQHYATLLQPILSNVLVHVLQRLSACWHESSHPELNAIVLGIEAAKVEVIHHQNLVELTRQVIDLIQSMIAPKTVVGHSNTARHVVTEKDQVLVNYVLYQSFPLASNALMLLTGCLCWSNAFNCRKAVQLCEEVLQLTWSRKEYQDILGRDIFGACVVTILKQPQYIKEDGLQLLMIELMKNIYCRLVLGLTPLDECKGIDPCKQPRKPDEELCFMSRQVLLSIPQMQQQAVVELEKDLRECPSAKHQKNRMKTFMEYAVGLNQQAEPSAKAIPNIAATLYIHSSKMNKDTFWQTQAQDIGTYALFDL